MKVCIALEISKEKLWNPTFIYLMLINTVIMTAFQTVNPYLAKYLVDIGNDVDLVGFIVGLAFGVSLFARPISGLASDRLNKKWLLIISTVINGLCIFGYIITKTTWIIILVRIIHGFSNGISSTANTALATQFIPKSRFAEGLGYLSLVYVVATALGPMIGEQLGKAMGFEGSFAVSGAVMTVAALSMLIINSESGAPSPENIGKKLKFSELIAVEVIGYAILGGMFSLGIGLSTSFLKLMADERLIVNASTWFFMSKSIVAFIPRIMAGRIIDRRGVSIVLIPAFALTAAAMFVLSSTWSIWTVVLAATLYAIGESLGRPAIQSTCLRSMGNERVGVATSTLFIGMDVGQSVGSSIGGAIAKQYGYGTMFASGGGLMLLGLAAYSLTVIKGAVSKGRTSKIDSEDACSIK